MERGQDRVGGDRQGSDRPLDRVVDRVVDVHIGKLRQKIESDPSKPRRILTVRGFGYRLAEESEL